jgi:hypothetical protein
VHFSVYAGIRLLIVDPGCPFRVTRATHALHPTLTRHAIAWR